MERWQLVADCAGSIASSARGSWHDQLPSEWAYRDLWRPATEHTSWRHLGVRTVGSMVKSLRKEKPRSLAPPSQQAKRGPARDQGARDDTRLRCRAGRRSFLLGM